MRQMQPGDKVVFCHKDGGFNALVIGGHGDDPDGKLDLTFIHPTEGLITMAGVPNVQHAKEEIEVPKLTGPKGKKKLEMVKQMGLKADGYWRP